MSENRWEGIDEFVAVAECSQFTAAAERLGVSSSHISRQIVRLEERLQTRLLYRSTRRVTLTEAGQTFLQHCQRLQDGREEALRAVGDLTSEPKGHAAHDLRRGVRRTLHRAAGDAFHGALPATADRHRTEQPPTRPGARGPGPGDPSGSLAGLPTGGGTRWHHGACTCAHHLPTWNGMVAHTVCRN